MQRPTMGVLCQAEARTAGAERIEAAHTAVAAHTAAEARIVAAGVASDTEPPAAARKPAEAELGAVAAESQTRGAVRHWTRPAVGLRRSRPSLSRHSQDSRYKRVEPRARI